MSDTEMNNLNRELVCVLFPGIVKNDDKALQCLGGIRTISQIHSVPSKKRLGLSYQPENPCLKKIYADHKPAPGVLLKVKIKKTKVDNEIKREVLSTTVIGHVKKVYKFDSMGDFQYLPVHRDESTDQLKCTLEQLLPSGVDNINFISEPAPLYIVPGSFTRICKPLNYCYTIKKYPQPKDVQEDEDDDVHHKTRVDRGAPVSRYTFNLIDDLPMEPQEYFIKQMKYRLTIQPKLEEEFNIVKKLFEERPIWSQNLIRYHTKIKIASLKFIMPCLSLFMKDGPWRTLWVKFGYDPRKEPGARIYQCLDFRLRHSTGLHSMVETRDQLVHLQKRVDRVSQAQRGAGSSVGDVDASVDNMPEGAVCFRPGMVPAQRQIFYQYCDVKIPEVEEILAKEPSPGYLCHQKRGWFPPNTDRVCRDHIFRYVKETLLAKYNSDLKFEQANSDEDSNSDDVNSTTTTEVDETSVNM